MEEEPVPQPGRRSKRSSKPVARVASGKASKAKEEIEE